jgi:hypothetical protein
VASLDGPRLKVGRAKKHIANVEREVTCFLNDNPYVIVEEPDPEFGGKHGGKQWRVRVKASTPDQLPVMVGDAIHNLRSALDLLIRQLVEANGKDPQREAFPIRGSEAEFLSGRDGLKSLKGHISADAMSVLRDLQPYQGGNDSLWRLHRLGITDKHRLLLVVGGAFTHLVLVTKFDGGEEPDIKLAIPPDNFLCPLEDGDVLPIGLSQTASASSGEGAPKLETDYKFAFAVAIHEPGIVEREPLVPFLSHLASTVEGTLAAFEALLPRT